MRLYLSFNNAPYPFEEISRMHLMYAGAKIEKICTFIPMSDDE